MELFEWQAQDFAPLILIITKRSKVNPETSLRKDVQGKNGTS